MSSRHITSHDSHELYRLQVLADAQLLDTPAEPAFDAIASLARRVAHAPIALIALVDAERQWFKARCGLDAEQTSRDIAFCDHTIGQSEIFMVEDARDDSRFASNPLVTGDPGIVFYAGIPLMVHGKDGGTAAAIGTLCVIDYAPRILSPDEIQGLRELADVAVTLIESRRLALRAVDHAQEQHHAAHELAYERRKFQQAERMATLGYFRFDMLDQHLFWSDQVFAIHGLPVSDAPPLNTAMEFYPPRARAEIAAAIANTIETGAPYDIETDFLTAQGDLRRVRSLGELEMLDGVPVALFGVFQDVTQRYRIEQMLRASAHSDTLTGLANRAAFEAEMENRMTQANDTGETLAILLIDLDGFKAVNDAQGHVAGDELLQTVGMRLRGEAYADCFVARLGGDEFVLIPRGMLDRATIEALARNILDDLRRPVITADCNATISGTIGIARMQPGDLRRDLMRRADQALYAAKHSERGTGRFYENDRVIRAIGPLDIRKAG